MVEIQYHSIIMNELPVLSFSSDGAMEYMNEFLVTSSELPELNTHSFVDLGDDFENFIKIKPKARKPRQPKAPVATTSAASTSAATTTAALEPPANNKKPKKPRAPRASTASRQLAARISSSTQGTQTPTATPPVSEDPISSIDDLVQYVINEKGSITQYDEKMGMLEMERERIGRVIEDQRKEEDEFQQLLQRLNDEVRSATGKLMQLRGEMEVQKRSWDDCNSELDATKKVASSKRQKIDIIRDKILGVFSEN